MRSTGYYGANRFLTSYVNRRLNLESQEERLAFRDLLLQCTMRDISSEISITMILEYGAWAKYPMKDRIKEIGVPICFLYGEWDWMCVDVANQLESRGDLKPGYHIAKIEKAGHHLYVDNALGTSAQVLKFTHGDDVYLDFIHHVRYDDVMNESVDNPDLMHPVNLGQ